MSIIKIYVEIKTIKNYWMAIWNHEGNYENAKNLKMRYPQ